MEITNKEKLELLKQTLSYLIVDISDLPRIRESIEELEGDYNTFLNPNFTAKLMESGLLSRRAKAGADLLYEVINSIDSKDWKIESFQERAPWQDARQIALLIGKYLE